MGDVMVLMWGNTLLWQSTALYPYLQLSFMFIFHLYMTHQLLLLAPHLCYARLQFLYSVSQSYESQHICP